jgi:hypothetical protein
MNNAQCEEGITLNMLYYIESVNVHFLILSNRLCLSKICIFNWDEYMNCPYSLMSDPNRILCSIEIGGDRGKHYAAENLLRLNLHNTFPVFQNSVNEKIDKFSYLGTG